MSDSLPQRLSSSHLEDLAFIVLSARADQDNLELYPDLTDDVRFRLRSRIKHLSRYNWPASVTDDPAFRRGWTLRQCCRLVIALLMLDAHLPPSFVVLVASTNELSFLSAFAERLSQPDRILAASDDKIAVLPLGEIQDAIDLTGWADTQSRCVHLVRRDQLHLALSEDLAQPGRRLLIDVATPIAALWRWTSGRRLMDDTARIGLIAEVARLRAQAVGASRPRST